MILDPLHLRVDESIQGHHHLPAVNETPPCLVLPLPSPVEIEISPDPERLPDGAHHLQHFDDGSESEATPLPLHEGQRTLHETDAMNAVVRLLLLLPHHHPLVEAGEAGRVPVRLLRI